MSLATQFADETFTDEELADITLNAVATISPLAERDALLHWIGDTRNSAGDADSAEKLSYYAGQIARRFGLPSQLSEEDADSVAAGIVAQVALSPGELARKICGLASEQQVELDAELVVGSIRARPVSRSRKLAAPRLSMPTSPDSSCWGSCCSCFCCTC